MLAQADSLDEAAPQILEGICRALGWPFGALWLRDADDHLRSRYVWHAAEDRLERFARTCNDVAFGEGEGFPGRAWASGEPQWVYDLGAEHDLPRAAAAAETKLHAAFAFPIFARDRLHAVAEFLSDEPCEPDPTLLHIGEAIGAQIGDFVEWEELEAELDFQRALLEYQSEAALDGIAVLAPDMRILYWNHRMLEIFDVAPEDVAAADGTALIERVLKETNDPAALAERAQVVFGDPDATERIEVPMADGRTIDLWTAPVRGPEGELYGRAFYCRDITEQKKEQERLRTEEEWSVFLAEASAVLAESLDVEAILDRLANLAVPDLADWCSIYMTDDQGGARPITVAHADPEKVRLARAMQDEYPPDPRVDTGVFGVIRSQTPLLISEIPEEMITAGAQDERHLELLRGLDLRSAMIVPIVARGHALGAITLVSAESDRRYTEEDLARASELASRAAFSIDNARLYEQTRAVAQTLQKSFLPPDLPEIPGAEVAARYFPAGEGILIGGDFYDAFKTGGKRWGLVLGDVSGKGLEAATVTTLARHTIRGAALSAERPSQVLNVLNTALLEQHQTDRFCTAVFASVEPRFARIRVVVSCGGHPAPYVIRNDGTVEQLGCGGTLLGFIDDISLEDVTVELEFGDKLFLYTDGVLDIRRKHGMFGPEGLERLLRECSKRGTHAAAEHIATTLIRLQEGNATDDIAFILLGVRSSVFRIRQRRYRIPGTNGD